MQKNYYRTAFISTYFDSPAQSGRKMTIFFMGNKMSSHSLFALPPKGKAFLAHGLSSRKLNLWESLPLYM